MDSGRSTSSNEMQNGIVCREQARQLSRQVEEKTQTSVRSHPEDTRSF